MGFTLHIKVAEARDLPSADQNGFSDPYAKVVVYTGKSLTTKVVEKKTKTIKKTLNPKWNETFHMDGVPPDGTIQVIIYDWDLIGRDDLLGSVLIDLNSLTHGNPVWSWYPVNGADGVSSAGHISLVLQVLKSELRPTLESALQTSKKRQLTRLQSIAISENHGVLLVEVVEAMNLAAKDMNGSSDPYCVIKFLSNMVKTNIIYKNLDPVWNEEFYIEVPADIALTEILQINVWDYDRISSDDPMGQAVIPLSSLQEGQLEDKWFPLSPMKKEKVSGEVHLLLQYTTHEKAQFHVYTANTHYSKLLELVTAHDYAVTRELLRQNESQELTRTIVNLFSAEGRILGFLELCFAAEIKRAVDENVLFRDNTAASKLAISYLKYVDTDIKFLRAILKPLIDKVCDDPSGFEVDPELVPKTEKLSQNQNKLFKTVQEFLDVILDCHERCPHQLRLILTNLRAAVSVKFPESGVRVIGVFLFLRFICPAIFTPESFDLLPGDPSPAVRRALILIAKTIHYVSHNMMFDRKEGFMMPFNDLVMANYSRVQNFLNLMSTVPFTEAHGASPMTATAHDEKARNMAILVKSLILNIDKIDKAGKRDIRTSEDPATFAELKLKLEELRTLLQKNSPQSPPGHLAPRTSFLSPARN